MSDTDPTAIFGKSRAEEEAKKKRDETMKSALVRGLIIGGGLLAVYVSVQVARADLGMGRYMILGLILLVLGKIIRDFETSKITAWTAGGYTLITLGSLIILVQILNSGVGALGVSSLEKMSEVSQRTACNMNNDLEGCAVIRQADQQVLLKQRKTELEQAEHDGRVELTNRQAAANQMVTDDQVTVGIAHLAGVQSGLYDFIIGKPNVVNPREVEMLPGQYYDIVLDPNRTKPHCSRVYPPRQGLIYDERPGPDRVKNDGNAVVQVVVYEQPIKTTDPLGNKC